MRYIKYIITLSIAITLMTFAIIEVKNNMAEPAAFMPVTNKVIVLDAGHGGIDPGALSNDKNTLEKDINLKIALKLRELLESSGALVILTREDDVSLYEDSPGKTIRQRYNENLKNRKKLIDESNADLFVSIHLNAFEQSKYYGAQTFYPAKDEKSKLLATFIQKELKRVADQSNMREVKPRSDIYLLKENKIPSILIECGFLSNEKETQLLKDSNYQEKIAWSIYAGMQKYLGSVQQNGQ
jgi:N-acetylmuramoyl-L-alanine amidase